MRLSLLLSLFVSLIPQFAFATDCGTLKGCEAKVCEIETNLAAAKSAGNTFKVAGLEKALKETKANCSDKGLVNKYQAKIQEKMKDVKEVEMDLAKARVEKDEKKIQKYSAKLKEKNAELEKLKAEASK